MDEIIKAARVEKQAVSALELSRINMQTLNEQKAEDVYAFRVAACDNRVDRDLERFGDGALADFAKMFVGRPVLMDHNWSARSQIARVYAGDVEEAEGAKRLILRAYMPRTERAAPYITDIEAGVLREVSVGVAVEQHLCSVCGRDYFDCEHRRGEEYEGKQCHVVLDGAADAYEVSFVAVPAQRGAGVVKRYERKERPEKDPARAGADEETMLRMARAMQELAEKRYGGNGK